MKKRKIILISVISALLIGLFVLLIVISVNNNEKTNKNDADVSKQSESSQEVNPVISSSTASIALNDEIKDDGTGLKPDESKAKSSTTNEIKEFKDKPKQSEKAALPEQSKPEVKPEANVVTKANPDTGISWDGKSQIVYTYKDGTTGTEKKNGAKYELIPGVIRVYMNADEKQWDGTCSHCGKVSGDGKNGTCVRWLMGDMTCPNCGTFVSHGKCHTCN